MSDDLIPPPPPPGYAPTPKSDKIHVVGDPVKLSEEQEIAVQRILNEDYEVIALTGRAGAGKSTVANFLMRNHRLTCCATTGKASVVNGSFWTVDALFSFSRDDWRANMQRAEKSIGRRNVSETILIDEGSMVGAKMLTPILEVCRRFNKRVVLVGDWAQAKPVKDDWITTHPDFNKRNVIKLLDCHRQSDRDMLDALNDVRMGFASDLASRVFKSRIVAECPDAPGIIRMVATNRESDSINTRHLGDLIKRTGALDVTLMCSARDIRDEYAQKMWPREPGYYAAKKEESSFAHKDPVAIGAQIMFTANARVTNFDHMEEEDFVPDRLYVNGDVGIIEDIWYTPEDEEAKEMDIGPAKAPDALDVLLNQGPVSTMSFEREPARLSTTPPNFMLCSKHLRCFAIRLTRTNERVRVYRHKMEFLDNKGLPHMAICGWPFRLGWASTIHKAQGSTVDKAWLDVESIRKMHADSRHGLAYVGLSRTRTLEGLFLGSWDPSVIVCDPAVKDLI